MAKVLEKAPQEYSSILASEELSMGATLMLEDLEATMDTGYRIRHDVKGTEMKKSKELTLSSFDGNCYNYRKDGNLA